MKIRMSAEAPLIAYKIKENIEQLKEVDNYVLSLQLDYRDNNTIFYLNKIQCINFETEWLEIKQKNNTHVFFDYNHIIEYCVINSEEV